MLSVKRNFVCMFVQIVDPQQLMITSNGCVVIVSILEPLTNELLNIFIVFRSRLCLEDERKKASGRVRAKEVSENFTRPFFRYILRNDRVFIEKMKRNYVLASVYFETKKRTSVIAW